MPSVSGVTVATIFFLPVLFYEILHATLPWWSKTIYGVEELTGACWLNARQITHTNTGKTRAGKQVQGTRASTMGKARTSRCRARAHPGFVSTYGFVLQDKQHGKARATRGKALVHAHIGHAVEAPGQWYLACRYRCRLSASTEPVTREMWPWRMVWNCPYECTVASGETCFGEATWVRKTVVRTYPVPLAAPLARRTPVSCGIAKIVILFCPSQ